MTPEKAWHTSFLATLAKGGNVSAACKAAKVSRTIAYRDRDEDTEFAAAWTQALDTAADALEAEARRRATTGTLKPVFYKGAEVGHVREYSDTLLIFLLKGARPEKYRENVKHEHTGPNGAPLPSPVNLTVLSDDELTTLERMLRKATASESGGGPAGATEA